MKNLNLLFISMCFFSLMTGVNAQTTSNIKMYGQKSYGIFVHYGFGGTAADQYGCSITQNPDGSIPLNVDEVADNFDVQGFVDDIDAMSPEYLIFTAWHCWQYPLYPSNVIDTWLGESHSSKRDVIQEVLDACDPKGIDVYLYAQPSEAHNFSPAQQTAVGYINRSTYTKTYNDYLNEMIAELTNRYKSQIKGFWFDKGLYYGCTDTQRIGETVRAIMPDAAIIANTYAGVSADFGAVEIMSVTTNFEGEGYPNADPDDVDTWPAFDRSISFVSDRAWFAQPGSLRYTSEEMYKYTVLEAGVNEEGGGVAWAIGPYPTSTISWNNGVLKGMTDLGVLIDEVAESIKGTVPSDSWPTAEGARIQNLTWGVATRSAVNNHEYLHVLNAPSGTTLTIDTPADGRVYTAAVNLRSGKSCTFSQTANEISITLNASDSWDAVDTVIKLTPSSSGNNTRANVAPLGTATQSTTAYAGVASRANDNNTNGAYDDASVSHTGKATDEWWMVTLDNTYDIDEITVYNRTDAAYMDRLNNFTVEVLNSNDQIIFTKTITSTPNPSVTIPTGNVVGNKVRVLQNKTGTALTLAEVEVYGTANTLSTNSDLIKDNSLLSISPNPVKDILNVKLKTTEDSTYHIFDATGQLLLTGAIKNGATAINLSQFNQGFYFIKVSNGSTSATQKIIKE
ncbi:T9SS type A sorting domain-containing protein [Tamlana agarivorans]|uniref:T9SS type A sorting domain-containing protein n=1 Tax=Pseudotamlana agarivorans TaxID=481183 RepID=A0ACC5UBM0_9FLAO|nr:T9SS type A sorting domain-containing protein [Tamlana agarivorans]MBU2951701.1 T9SS type A sorting domain-containing protein [Tamlana agarivorans]